MTRVYQVRLGRVRIRARTGAGARWYLRGRSAAGIPGFGGIIPIGAGVIWSLVLYPPRRPAPRRRAAPAADRVETVARVLHGRRHRAGYAHTCDRCRADARVAVAALVADAAPPGTR